MKTKIIYSTSSQIMIFCHPGESREPASFEKRLHRIRPWIPDFAGMTVTQQKSQFSTLVSIFLTAISILGLMTSAHAAIITVDTTSDDPAEPGCSLREAIENTNNNAATYADCPAGEPGPGIVDEIHFAIPGAGVQTIQVTSDLPHIIDSLFINGETQFDSVNTVLASCEPRNLLIEIPRSIHFNQGANVSKIRGLVVNHDGIVMDNVENIVIECSYIGVDPTATVGYGGSDRIKIDRSSNVTIGGEVLGAWNVISGGSEGQWNNGRGIHVVLSDHVFIKGNKIGTNAQGDMAISNADGISLYNFHDVVIGGPNELSRNIISGNGAPAISMSTSNGAVSFNLVVQGNYIGVDASGESGLLTWDGEGQDGILVREISNVLIGGDAPGEGNVIIAHGQAHNALHISKAEDVVVQGNKIGMGANGNETVHSQNGITVKNAYNILIGGDSALAGNMIAYTDTYGIGNIEEAASKVLIRNNQIFQNKENGIVIAHEDTQSITILSNRIFNNLQEGIDLQDDGWTDNDDGDIDTGPNDLLNFPIISTVEVVGQDVLIDFVLDASLVNTDTFRVEFFSNPDGFDPSGYGEGKFFIGAVDITVGASVDFCPKLYHAVLSIPDTMDPAGILHVTSTATEKLANGLFGSTSEFSGPYQPVEKTCDFGDAPDPSEGTSTGNYQTTVFDNGARHKLSPKIYLGSCADADPGTLQNVEAAADDNENGSPKVGKCTEGQFFDDEDGVSLPSVFPPGSLQNITVTTYGGAYLYAWADWNQDGDWNDAGEKIANGTFLSTGNHTIAVSVPSSAPQGFTHLRVRYSTQQNLEPMGPASNGEVEDYRIKIAPQLIGEGGEERTTQKWSPALNKRSR